MNRIFLLVIIFCCVLNISFAKILTVGRGLEYARVGLAADDAMPGDTIMLIGWQKTGEYISNLKGTDVQPILICGEENNYAHFSGGYTAMQFSNPEYIHFKYLSFEGQAFNGVNIDDAGNFSSPAKGIVIENCIWYGMNATGNNDCLKMSGVDDFVIKNSIFMNGSAGGSMIDMVGCHDGIIEICKFQDGGSNCIQAKGGCSDVVIRRNEFVRGGQRSINIGGSTGMEYFRPNDAPFESARIIIHSNIFFGSIAPVAFVGTVNSVVNHNTFINPEKWCIRILQENNHERLAKCSNNTISNNIFYFSNISANPVINIGPNTFPETFEFRNNLWYNHENPSWNNLNLPSSGVNQIVGQNPLFQSFQDSVLMPLENSPALEQADYGILSNDSSDFYANKFKLPATIGAIQANPASNVENIQNDLLKIYPQPSSEYLIIESGQTEMFYAEVYDMSGNFILQQSLSNPTRAEISLKTLQSGSYFLKIIYSDENFSFVPFVVVK